MKIQVQHYIAIFFTLVYLVSCTGEKENPNIILIVADDLGWKDLGCMGSTYFETPNIDKLASEGMLFTQAYAGASNCAPSRACLMTGQNTPRHGVYTVSPSGRGHEKTRRIIPTKNSNTISDTVMTLGRELQYLGYKTATMGKWHIGIDPTKQGFNVNVAGNVWGHPKSYWAPYIKPDIDAPEGEYLTDRITSEAVSFIEENKDGLFFLYLPFYAVHTPIQGKPHLVHYYKKKGGDSCQGNAEYAAMVTNMDSCIGAIINTLENFQIDKNTLVFFTSDNGGIHRISCQKPLRGGKGSYYEGGTRVPLIVKYPGNIEASTSSNVQVSNLDFYPTILDILGAEPKQKLLDGLSIKKVLYNQDTLAERPFYWHFPIYLQAYKSSFTQWTDPLFRTRPGTSMRYGNWKLIDYFETGNLELYNLQNDLGERNNLADSLPEKLKEMHQMMINWRNETGAPVPKQPNLKYDKEFEENKIKSIVQDLNN